VCGGWRLESISTLRYVRHSLPRLGGAEKAAESAILSENEPDVLRDDILKIGHPCSKNSTMPGLLDAVRLAAGCYFRRRGKPYGRPGRLFMNDCSKAVFRRCAQTRRAWFTLSPMEIVSRFLLLGLIRR